MGKSKKSSKELVADEQDEEVKKSPKKEKKNKKDKTQEKEKEDEAEPEDVVGGSSGSKEKKSKKSKKSKRNREEEDNVGVDVDDDAEVEAETICGDATEEDGAPLKKMKNSGNNKRTSDGDEDDSSCTSAIAVEVSKEPKSAKSKAVVTGAVAAHSAKLSKMLPTREERARREKQRKMQAYVSELRAKGTSEEEIRKLKKKITNKLSKVGANVDYSSIGGMTDLTLNCKDCGQEFVFTCQEQNFYREKGLAPAVRCRECIASKRERMAHFDQMDSKNNNNNNKRW